MEDSPFKRHLQNGNHEISSEGVCDIAVGGFGLELDRRIENDLHSLNLNSGLQTPTRKKDLSEQQQEKVGSILDHDLSASRNGSGFNLEVEKVG